MRPRLSALLDRLWEQALRTPQRFVVLSFAVASLLLLLIAAHGLTLLRDHEIQSLQQTQQLQVAGISSVLNVEAERLMSVRSFAEHQIRLQTGPHAVATDPPLQQAYNQRNQDLWMLPVPEGDAVLLGVGPRLLSGLAGFARRDRDLLPGLFVARGLSHLLSAEPPSPLVARRLLYVSTNGFFVAHPPVPATAAAATLQHVAGAGYLTMHTAAANPQRTLRWDMQAASDGSGDSALALSVPVYLNDVFRGVAITELSQPSLDQYLSRTSRPSVQSFLADIDGNLIAASAGSVRRGETLSMVLPPAWREATAAEMFRRGAGTMRFHDGSRIVFQRIGSTGLVLVDYFSATQMLWRVVSQLSASLAAAALSLGLLLWVTLRGFNQLFSHYLARGDALREMAETDALTGLANRREFESRFGIEYRHSLRERAPMSLLMIDIDRFKRINDHWGHASGDRVLRTLADVLRATLRTIDVPARIGGEEFAVLLPRTGLDEATRLAERLREVLGQTPCDPAADAIDKGPIRFTVSIGVADAGADGTDGLDTMLMVADRRLYAAKNAGRNRVVSDDRVPEPRPEVPAPMAG
ncbi:diguanylate cyclase [Cupriavidus taiwanensis]|uniref:diguanylate cyclase n=1 Tax=Cupriavidus taiwanensis TaxID=164546 RepID=UPI00253FB9AE|nr:diguanylate cyclase [Cupriavidus taiwanensis]MDK3026579.1 diguanylate cyclase [Cupriavidus taiwanensis]